MSQPLNNRERALMMQFGIDFSIRTSRRRWAVCSKGRTVELFDEYADAVHHMRALVRQALKAALLKTTHFINVDNAGRVADAIRKAIHQSPDSED